MLTDRCWELLRLLRASRWLSTGQVRRRFFAHASFDAAHKRLRILVRSGHLRRIQPHPMAEALYTLGPEGKRALEQRGDPVVVLERTPPNQLNHLLGINDLRIAAELAEGLVYFFACWELPGLGWSHAIIPDAVFALGNQTYAVEFDRGVEGVRFFVRSKVAAYRRGFDDLAVHAVLIVTDRHARLESLAQAVRDGTGRFLFTTLDRVREEGLAAPIFSPMPGSEGVALV